MAENTNPMLPATQGAPETAVKIPPQDCSLTFGTRAGMEALQRAGRLFSQSALVPDTYQGEKGMPSCCIALDLANRIGANPLMVMQNLYIVHGRPGWSAKFKIATFNQCGRFSPIRYEMVGVEGEDSWGCRAWCIDMASGERIEGPLVTIGIAKAEGWVNKQGSKWKTMPELMLRYRSGGELVDTVAPELSMGLPTREELEDIDGEAVPSPKVIKDTTPAIQGSVITWAIPSLESFDVLMDKAYIAFRDAGMEEHWNVFEGKWRSRRGVGDDKGTLRDLQEEVERLTPAGVED